MKTKLLVIGFFLTFQWMCSQEFFLVSGKNLTSYDYKWLTSGAGFNLESKIGSYYEVGYEYYFNEKISYVTSMTLNQFNSFSTNEVKSYSWNTSYLGIQNAASYTLFKTWDELELKLKAGVNIATIIDGKEEINGIIYDIKKEPEFSGVFIQPVIGLDLRYVITDYFTVSMGYNFSKAFKFSHTSDEELSFINNQVQVGTHFSL
jgi:hypothetical protein